MIRNSSSAPFRFVWMALLLAAPPLAAQEAGKPAILSVRLPADARLIVEGRETTSTGATRRFTSPPLLPGKKYQYTFIWTYRKDGKYYRGEKNVRIEAGDEKEVDLTAAEVKETNTDLPGSGDAGSSEDAKIPKLAVPFVPTPQDIVEKMLDIAVLTDKDVLYDLGCGDGRIVITAAKKYGCKAVGFDLDPKRVKEARDNVKAAGVESLVTIEEKDIFKVDLKSATVVTLYLLPDVNVKLLPQLNKLKTGAYIISHDFAIEGYKPEQEVTVTSKEDKKRHKIYVWFAPLKKK